MESPHKRHKISNREHRNSDSLLSPQSTVDDISDVESSSVSIPASESTYLDVYMYQNDYDFYFANLEKIPKTGPVWNLYKPIRDDSYCLYAQILKSPNKCSHIVDSFLRYCKSKPPEYGIYFMFRLFYDAAGLQNFDIHEYRISVRDDVHRMVKDTNTNQTIVALNLPSNFLLNDQRKDAKIFQCGLYNFLQKFFIAAFKSNLLNSSMICTFLDLIKINLKYSTYLPLYYASHIFALKCLSALCKIRSELIKGPATIIDWIDLNIHVTYDNCIKIAYLQDTRLNNLKILCVKDLVFCIQSSPAIFLKSFSATAALQHFLYDQCTQLRIICMDIYIAIIKDKELSKYLTTAKLRSLFKLFWMRVSDVNLKVQLQSLEIVQLMITHFFSEIENEIRAVSSKMLEFIFNDSYRIGSEVVKCVILAIEKDNCDRFTIIKILIDATEEKPEYDYSVLVESCFDNIMLMRNWNLMISVLKNGDEDIDIIGLSTIIFEAASLALTGNLRYPRNDSIKNRPINLDDNRLIARELYPNLIEILNKYRSQDQIIQNIFKILVLINAKYVVQDYNPEIIAILNKLTDFVKQWDNEQTLISFCDYVVYVSEHFQTLKLLSKEAISDLLLFISQQFRNFVLERSNDEHYLNALKLRIIYSKLDLNQHLDQETLIGVIAETDVEYSAEFTNHIWACWQWSLIWGIKEISSSTDSVMIKSKITVYGNFMEKIFNCWYAVMQRDDLNLKNMAFERFYETCMGIVKEYANRTSLEEINFTYKNKRFISYNVIMSLFAVNMSNADIAAVNANNMILRYFYLCCKNLLPKCAIYVIFKYYNKQFKYYSKCEEMFKTILNVLYKKNPYTFQEFIFNTLVSNYEELKQKQKDKSLEFPETQRFHMLVKNFCNLQYVNEDICTKIIFRAISYVAETNNVSFLQFIIRFLNRIKPEDNVDRFREILFRFDNLKTTQIMDDPWANQILNNLLIRLKRNINAIPEIHAQSKA